MRAPAAVWWGKLSARDRRALTLCAVVLVAALAFQAAVRPYLYSLGETRDRVERERALQLREQTLLSEVNAYSARMPDSEAALLREAPRLFGGPDLATASASLVNYVSSHGIRHRVFVQQSVTRPPEAAASGVARLQVDLRAVGDLEGILSMLQDLESGSKLLTVERLTIAQAERVAIGQGRGDDEVLGMSATVSGYALSDVEMATDSDSAIPNQTR